jgi:hypothetical protein
VCDALESRMADFDLSGCGDLFRSECCLEVCRAVNARVRLEVQVAVDASVLGLVQILGMGLKPLREALRSLPPELPAESRIAIMRAQCETMAKLLCEEVLPRVLDTESRVSCMR